MENYNNICWICNGWQEACFQWELNEENENIELSQNNYIHLDFNDYEGELMEKNDMNQLIIKRVCPPKKIKFFFTINKIQMTSNNFMIEEYQNPIKKNVKIEEKKIDVELKRVNYIDITTNDDIIHQKFYYPLITSIPRFISIAKRTNDPFIWDFNKSIFKNFKNYDTDVNNFFQKL